MAAKPDPPIGSVSCRVTGCTIQQLKRMGLPTSHLTCGLAFTLDDLQSHSASILWDDYLVFLRNSHSNLPTDQLVELCTSYQRFSYIRPRLSAAELWFHPAQCFKWVADSESGAIQQLFRCVKTRFTQVSDREVVVTELVEPGYSAPPDIFWETQSITFGALTTYFGLGSSIVTWEPIEHGAAFRICLPRRRPFRFVLSWIASWFHRETAEDIRSALSIGHERRLQLEREYAERKVTKAALRESEERFRRITEAVPGVVYQYYLDSDGRDGFVFVSAGATDLTGYTPEEVMTQPERIWGRINPDDIPGVQHSIRESAQNGTPWQHQFRFQTKTGDIRWVNARSIPEPVTASGRVVWNGILNDVTAERQAEAQLHARDALLQKLSEQVPGFIYQYQQWPDGRSCFPYASEGIRDIYEVTPDEVRGSAEAVFGRLHADDYDAVAESIRRSLESLEPWRCEYRVQLPKRGVRWADGHAVPERMLDGSTIWHGYIRDVTDRKWAEDEIRLARDAAERALADLRVASTRAEQFYRMCDVAGQGIGIARLDGTLMYMNPAFRRLLELPDGDDVTRRSFWELVPPEDHPLLEESVLEQTRETGSWSGEFDLLTLPGKRVPIINTVVLLRGPDGTVVGYSNIATDITEQKRAEAALRESEERLRMFIESAPAGVAMLDRDLRYISHSRRWLTDYGLGDQNLVGRFHYEVFPEVTDRWKEIHRRCLTGVSERCEQDRFERANGTVDYIRWEIQPWTDVTGAVGGLVFFTELITARVCAEEQVRTSLREKEAMLKEIHHRVKNNLQVISSLLSLQAARETHPVVTDVLAESQNRVRAMALVHETLYRSDDLARVDLSRYIGELCGYLFRSYGVDSTRVSLELDVESVTVSLEKTIPCGLLMNEIIANSLKYAFPGTRSGTVAVRAHMRPDGHLALTLADDGIGLPADLAIGHTTSLGLQLVGILAEQLGGQLTIERFGGTRFELSFAP